MYMHTFVPYQNYIAGYKEAEYDDVADVGMQGGKQPSDCDDSKPDEQVDYVCRKRKGGESKEAVTPTATQAPC